MALPTTEFLDESIYQKFQNNNKVCLTYFGRLLHLVFFLAQSLSDFLVLKTIGLHREFTAKLLRLKIELDLLLVFVDVAGARHELFHSGFV
jgi:hypothetical protein